LKLKLKKGWNYSRKVAPHAGAWIEIGSVISIFA